MRSLRYLLPTLFLFTSLNSFAESWMKKENSSELGLYVDTHTSCPFSNADIKNLIEGEFLRARIKPTADLDLYLQISVTCMNAESGSRQLGYAVHYDIIFGTLTANYGLMHHASPSYGSMLLGGMNDISFLKNAIRDSASNALTDYLKANL